MCQRPSLCSSFTSQLQRFQRLLSNSTPIIMQIEIHRLTSNPLYTEGHITVNGADFCHAIEHTPLMLPTGKYKVELKKISSSHRVIAIIPLSSADCDRHQSLIESGDSWITARNIAHSQSLTMSPIIIGTPLIPGVIKQSANIYNRLFERLKKCKTVVTLTIHDNHCKPNSPISHWVKRETRNSKL